MCDPACIDFVMNNVKPEDIKNKRILELGSFNVNGSVQIPIKDLNPKEYIGTDIADGPGVDVICNVYDIITKFGTRSFDVVISTEMLEHVDNWRLCISNIKNILLPQGLLFITTRSIGFSKHDYPFDFWRYQKEDMEYIFSDFEILKVGTDIYAPGIFIKARKPSNFIEKDLSDYKLYNINTNSR